MLIETCPKCGADLRHIVYPTYPPIPAVECPRCGWRHEEKPDAIQRVPYQASAPSITSIGFYDKEEIIEGATVQILTNTVTGETSIGWWRGSKEDMPGYKEDLDDNE